MRVLFGLQEMTLAKGEREAVKDYRLEFEARLADWRKETRKSAQVLVSNALAASPKGVSRKDVKKWTDRFLELTTPEPQFRPSFVIGFFSEIARR